MSANNTALTEAEGTIVSKVNPALKVQEHEDIFEINRIAVAPRPKGLKEVFRIFTAVILGKGIERSVSDVGLLRKLCNSPRLFKIIARYLMWKWPHDLQKQKKTLDFKGNKHLEYVHAYTVTQDMTQVTKGSGRRAERYYQIVSLPPRDMSKENVLIIGGKNVVELFIAWVYGFKWENIFGIDLFSLHPKIQVMDMENMTFPNGFFDNVTMANVYGYQLDPEKCIAEISRVLKPGGKFCFNSAHDSNSKTPVNRIRVTELVRIFNKHQFEIIYHSFENKSQAVSHIWSLQKKDPSNPSLDPIPWSHLV